MSASLPPSKGQSNRRQRVITPRGVRTVSVPKWSNTSRTYWPAERSCRAGSAANSVRYSANEMTRRLRAKLSRISPEVCDSQPLESNDPGTIGSDSAASVAGPREIAFTLAHRGSTVARAPNEGTLHNFPSGPSTVIKEP